MFNENVNLNKNTKNDCCIKNNNLNPIDSIVEILSIGIIRLELKKLKNCSNFNNDSNSDYVECNRDSFSPNSKIKCDK